MVQSLTLNMRYFAAGLLLTTTAIFVLRSSLDAHAQMHRGSRRSTNRRTNERTIKQTN